MTPQAIKKFIDSVKNSLADDKVFLQNSAQTLQEIKARVKKIMQQNAMEQNKLNGDIREIVKEMDKATINLIKQTE